MTRDHVNVLTDKVNYVVEAELYLRTIGFIIIMIWTLVKFRQVKKPLYIKAIMVLLSLVMI